MTNLHKKEKTIESNFALYCMATMVAAAAVALEVLAIRTISASPPMTRACIPTSSPALLISLALGSIAVVAALVSRLPEPVSEQPPKKLATDPCRLFKTRPVDSKPFYGNNRDTSHRGYMHQHDRGNAREFCGGSYKR